MTKIHPFTKLNLVFWLSIIAFILPNIYDLLILLIFDIILIILSRVPLFSKGFRKFVIIFLLANISIFIAWLLFSTRPGNVILFETSITIIPDKWIWHILITDQTLFYALSISLRTIIMFFLMLFFFVAISDRDLIHGLRSIKVPFAICLMMSLTFRGLSIFTQEYSIVRDAMKTRGVEFDKVSIIKKIKNFISIFITLIVLMFKRTEEMEASIEARGIPFRSKRRTIYHYYPFRKIDYTILCVLFLFLGFSIYLRIINGSFILIIIHLFG
ncbi:MAG: energy-coupling factor transporter transmembrane component T family protein [Candidatus Helarchaeota archaeon]